MTTYSGAFGIVMGIVDAAWKAYEQSEATPPEAR